MKKIDMSALKKVQEKAEKQEVNKGFSLSEDSNFPVHKTEDAKFLVYFPKLNLKKENTEDVYIDLCTAFTHKYNENGFTRNVRCIKNITVDGVYNGECPFCDAVNRGFDLYNLKLQEKASSLGINSLEEARSSDALKEVRTALGQELPVNKAEKLVVFPIVKIPYEGKFIPKKGLTIEDFIVEYVVWSEKKYIEKTGGMLSSVLDENATIAGKLMVWDYTYTREKGKPFIPRDAGKSASYTILSDTAFIEKHYKALMPLMEKAVESFTNDKAIEVLKPFIFNAQSSMEEECAKIMIGTEKAIKIFEQLASGSSSDLTIAEKTSAQDALSAFGVMKEEGGGEEPTGFEVIEEGVTFGN